MKRKSAYEPKACVMSAADVWDDAQRMQKAMAILRECDQAAVAFTRKTDSAETIRRLRKEDV